tara:strand:+ start:2825 stop:3661 length:837 start_codon:yes stop_codon:yes gene_type:complete
MAYSTSHYKRTVHCSYCRQPGHNRSSCPKYAAKIEELRIAEGEDSYYVRVYDAKKAKRTGGAKERKCSYCTVKGHNRATCSELQSHMEETKEQNRLFRALVLKRFQAMGVAPGALCKSDRFRNRVENTVVTAIGNRSKGEDPVFYHVPMVIRHINWNDLNFWCTEISYFDKRDPTRCPPLSICPIDKLFNNRFLEQSGYPFDVEILNLLLGEQVSKEWEEGTHWRASSKAHYFLNITSSVPAIQPPKGWLDCADKSTKALYKNRSSWMGPAKSQFMLA